MKIVSLKTLVAVIAISLTGVYGCAESELGSDAVKIGISSENLFLQDAIVDLAQDNTGKPVGVETKYGSIRLTDLACEGQLDAVAIADEMWPAIRCPNAPWTNNSGKLYSTYIQFALPTSKAEELGWVGRVVDRQEVVQALQSGKIRLATTLPTHSNSGYNTLLWLVRGVHDEPNLTPEQITPQALEPLQPIYQNLAVSSESTAYLAEKLAQNWPQDTMAALYRFLYDPDGRSVYHEGQQLRLQSPVTLIQVSPAVNVSPSYFVSTADEELKQELEQTFVSIADNSNLFRQIENRNQPLAEGIVIESTPVTAVHQNLLTSFHPSIRQKRWIVGIIDASGSMSGTGYNELIAAFEQLLDTEQAKQNFLYSPDDRFSLIAYQGVDAFAVSPNEEERDNLLQDLKTQVKPSGGTPVREGLIAGMREALTVPPDYKVEIFLFTDGRFSDPVNQELISLYQQLQEQGAEFTIVGAGDVDQRQLTSLSQRLEARPIVSQNAEETLEELLKAFREAQI